MPGWINSDRKEGPRDRPQRRHPRRPAARERLLRLRRQHPRAPRGALRRPRARARGAAPRPQARRRPPARAARSREGRSAPTSAATATTSWSPTRSGATSAASCRAARLVRLLADALRGRLHRGAAPQGRLRARPAPRVPADGEPLPRDRRARQPRAREPLRRGARSLESRRRRCAGEQGGERRRGVGAPELRRSASGGSGCDVGLVEEIERAEPAAVDYFRATTERFGLTDSSALVDAVGAPVIGTPVRHADLLVNVSGNVRAESLLERFETTALRRYRSRLHADLARDAARSRSRRTTSTSRSARTSGVPAARSRRPGSTGGRPDRRSCSTSGPPWQAPAGVSRPSPPGAGRSDASSTMGRTYGLKLDEFRKFFELPTRSGRTFELALDIHPDERADLEALRDNGWRLVDPREVAGDPDAFRHYVQGSGAEFSVAQGIYVETGQRLVQRPHHPLPRLGEARARPGHRLQPRDPHRRGAPVLPDARGGRRRRARRSRPTTTGTPAPPVRSPRSTSTPTGSSRSCSRMRSREDPPLRHGRRRPRPGRGDLGGAPVRPRPAPARARRRPGRAREGAHSGESGLLRRVVARFELDGRAALVVEATGESIGLPYRRILDAARAADLAHQHHGHAPPTRPRRAGARPALPRPRPCLQPALGTRTASTSASRGTRTSSPSGSAWGRRARRCRPPAVRGWRRRRPSFSTDWPVAGPAVREGLTTVGNWRATGRSSATGSATGRRRTRYRRFFDLPTRLPLPVYARARHPS